MKAQAGSSPASRNNRRRQGSQARYTFITAIVAAAMLAAIPANAQNASANPPDKQSNSLDEIVVRAEKQGRSIMDTATSVVVIDAAALEQQAGLEPKTYWNSFPISPLPARATLPQPYAVSTARAPPRARMLFSLALAAD